MTGSERDPLLDTVRDAWQRWDPLPEDLVDTVLVGLALDDLDAQYELLTLVTRNTDLAGARAVADERVLIEFRADGLSVLVRVSHHGSGRRLDGWVTPATGGTVGITHGERTTTVPIDGNGRFDLPDARPGLVRLVVHPELSDRTVAEFRTTLFEI